MHNIYSEMRIIGIFICFFITSTFFGQKVISGRIYDLNTGKPIKDATVIEYTTTFGAFSDSAGNFNYSSKKKRFVLLVSHVKYQNKRIEVGTKKMNHLDIGLEIERFELGGLDLNLDYLSTILELQCEEEYIDIQAPDSLFTIVESSARYPGALDCLDKHFAMIFYYPIKNAQLNPFGLLQIFFDINEDGIPINIQVDKEVQKKTLALIEQTFNTMKKWKPAEQRGNKILTSFTYRLLLEN